MIGFNHLGRLGRLGNQMFQFAALKGIARNRGFEFCVPFYPDEVNDGIGNMLKTEIFNVFDVNADHIGQIQAPIEKEPHFHFSQEHFDNCPDNVSLFGFYQTEKYFKHIEDEIRGDFAFKDEILEPCKEMILQLNTPPIALHIRRTDYITNPNHTALGLDYYQKALEKFDRRIPVLVFSDDPEWCNQQELFSDDRFLIAEGNSNYVDLCLMTLCSGHIIANSSFSWWGAWLATHNKVVAPSGWFTGSDNEHLDTKDLIPETWMVI